jgi:hypothetical protein
LGRLSGEAEANSSLRVTREGPLDACINEHLSTVLTSVGTIALLESNILYIESI